MTVPAKITDMKAFVIALLLWQFRDSESLTELIALFANEVQSCEDTYHQLVDDRMLATAEGAQLDQYGKIIQWLRAGMTDDEFRTAIQIAIQINTTHGEALKAAGIVAQIVGVSVRYVQRGRAHYSLDWDGLPPPGSIDLLNDVVMERISPAGVSWELIQFYHMTDPPFQFDTDGQGYDLGRLARRIDT